MPNKSDVCVYSVMKTTGKQQSQVVSAVGVITRLMAFIVINRSYCIDSQLI